MNLEPFTAEEWSRAFLILVTWSIVFFLGNQYGRWRAYTEYANQVKEAVEDAKRKRTGL